MNKKTTKYFIAVILLILAAAFLMAKPEKNDETLSASKENQTAEVSTDASSEESVKDSSGESSSNENSDTAADNQGTAAEEYPEESVIESEPEKPLEAIEIISVEAYTGPFVEDGSDEPVENVMMITVKNNSQQTLQYAEAVLTFGSTAAQFAFSTLRPGEVMSVLEKNRLEYQGETVPDSCQFENVIYFAEEPDLCSDKIQISGLDGAFNVRNISGEDLSGNIAIYYKNKQEQGYFGGITYRVVIQGGMAKDEIRQLVVNHFKADQSQIVFADYTEME